MLFGFRKFGIIRIRILFGFRNMAEYHFCPNTDTYIIEKIPKKKIIPNINTKTFKTQQILKLKTVKIVYWVFCAVNTTETFKFRLLVKFGFQTSTEYEYYSGLENHANTNTNIFGFEKSSEYEYEYYSV